MSAQTRSVGREAPGLSWWCLAAMYFPVMAGMILATCVAASDIGLSADRAAGVWYAPSLAATEPERKAE